MEGGHGAVWRGTLLVTKSELAELPPQSEIDLRLEGDAAIFIIDGRAPVRESYDAFAFLPHGNDIGVLIFKHGQIEEGLIEVRSASDPTGGASADLFQLSDALRKVVRDGSQDHEVARPNPEDASLLVDRPSRARHEATVARVSVPRAPVLTRVYKGKQQGDAVQAMQYDAAQLAQHGYYPTSQSWAQGQWGAGAFIVAILLFIVVIGLLVFLYMLIVKPEGTLTVTYTLREAAKTTPIPPPALPVAPVPPPPTSAPLEQRLTDLKGLRDAGHIDDEEYKAQRARILGDL